MAEATRQHVPQLACEYRVTQRAAEVFQRRDFRSAASAITTPRPADLQRKIFQFHRENGNVKRTAALSPAGDLSARGR
jgi:hypothetical protein